MRLSGGFGLALRSVCKQRNRCFSSSSRILPVIGPVHGDCEMIVHDPLPSVYKQKSRCFSSASGIAPILGPIHVRDYGKIIHRNEIVHGSRCSLFNDLRQQQKRGFLGFGDGDEDWGLAKHYEERRVLGYSQEQLYDVVAAVDMYKDFVPWCMRSDILWRKDNELEAELEIGFKFFVESYVSHVKLTRPKLIKTTVSQSAIFEHLDNVWEISPGSSPGTCNLHFLVDFQFRSPLYTKVANVFFDEVVARLVGAFEGRCLQVYGPSKVVMHA